MSDSIPRYRSKFSIIDRVRVSFPKVSPYTKQSFRDECDINILMSKYLSSGVMPVINQRAPQYLDVTGIDYQSSMEFVAGAQTLFNELPSKLRSRFDNDPAQFLNFCSDDRNRVEMASLGLLKPQSEWVVPLTSVSSSTPSQGVSVPSGDISPDDKK